MSQSESQPFLHRRSFTAPYNVIGQGRLHSPPFGEDQPPSRRVLALRVIGISLLFVFLYITFASSYLRQDKGVKSVMDLAVERIKEDTANHRLVWDRLAEMSDAFGPRPTGSNALEKVIMFVCLLFVSLQ